MASSNTNEGTHPAPVQSSRQVISCAQRKYRHWRLGVHLQLIQRRQDPSHLTKNTPSTQCDGLTSAPQLGLGWASLKVPGSVSGALRDHSAQFSADFGETERFLPPRGCAEGEFCRCPIHGFYHWLRIGNKCFSYHGHPVNFFQAEAQCRRYSCRGHLASIHSCFENHQIYRLIIARNYTHPKTWIGGLRHNRCNGFHWTDGSCWNYHNWYPGEPNNQYGREYCTEINFGGKCASRAV
ncbi:LECG protein, partial [Atractosteus spatula]|nr:LECG protein [Atractosteus spatula]